MKHFVLFLFALLTFSCSVDETTSPEALDHTQPTLRNTVNPCKMDDFKDCVDKDDFVSQSTSFTYANCEIKVIYKFYSCTDADGNVTIISDDVYFDIDYSKCPYLQAKINGLWEAGKFEEMYQLLDEIQGYSEIAAQSDLTVNPEVIGLFQYYSGAGTIKHFSAHCYGWERRHKLDGGTYFQRVQCDGDACCKTISQWKLVNGTLEQVGSSTTVTKGCVNPPIQSIDYKNCRTTCTSK